MDADPGVVAEMATQRLRLGRMKLHQNQPILRAQQMRGEGG